MKVRRYATALTMLMAATACSQADQTVPYKQSKGWAAVCLGRLTVDWPERVLVAEADALHSSGYGFDPGIVGAATARPTWNRIKVQETVPTNAVYLKGIRSDVASDVQNAIRRLTPEEKKNDGEADLGDPNTYGFNLGGAFDIGYLDDSDQRIRLFVGGTGKGESATAKDIQDKYRYLRRIYTPRAPITLPTQSGVCTPWGFFKDEPSLPNPDYNIEIAVRSLKYPSLIFFVTTRPATERDPRRIEDLRDPNDIKAEDVTAIKGMGAVAALFALADIKKLHPAERITLAGQPARLIAREYRHDGHLAGSGGAGAAYEIQADAVGVAGDPGRPVVNIRMAAALPDPDPLPPPTRHMSFGKEIVQEYQPKRPALKGVKTPPFDEAMVYFKQVIASVRPMTQLPSVTVSAAAPESTAPQATTASAPR